MMEDLVRHLHTWYPIQVEHIEPLRDMGSTAFAVYAGTEKFFLRVIKPAFSDTARTGADIQLFLQHRGFPVPEIQLTRGQFPYAETGEGMLILYAYLEGDDVDPDQDAEAIGALVGRLHREMAAWPGRLVNDTNPLGEVIG